MFSFCFSFFFILIPAFRVIPINTRKTDNKNKNTIDTDSVWERFSLSFENNSHLS